MKKIIYWIIGIIILALVLITIDMFSFKALNCKTPIYCQTIEK